MPRKVFLSVLGTGFYRECRYNKSELVSKSIRFIQLTMMERLPNGNFNTEIVPKARPCNASKYSTYDFPKTRRTTNDDDALLVGFVKLTNIEEKDKH